MKINFLVLETKEKCSFTLYLKYFHKKELRKMITQKIFKKFYTFVVNKVVCLHKLLNYINLVTVSKFLTYIKETKFPSQIKK